MNISRSKLREELLRHYFLHPGERYYLRELERLLGFPVGNIRRELTKLKKIGLFSSEKVGNLVYFSLNKKCPLYNEIKSTVLKTIGLGDVFKEYLRKLRGIKYAFIYGSFAKGEEIAGSDIDIMIVGNVAQNELVSALHKVEDQISRIVNYTCFTRQELKERIKKRNHFIMNVMKDKKMMIIGDESELQRIRK